MRFKIVAGGNKTDGIVRNCHQILLLMFKRIRANQLTSIPPEIIRNHRFADAFRGKRS